MTVAAPLVGAPAHTEADLGTRVRQAARRALRRGKYFTGDRPWLLPLHMRLTPEGTSRAINDATDIVIEGFPRSGNTFAVFAFRQSQLAATNVASHIHHLAPLHVARRRELPLLIVARDPLPCLASYLVAAPHGRPAGVLREYIHHHTGVLGFQRDAVFATFDQVTEDFSAVIDRVNARFGTAFDGFDHSAENEAVVFEAIESYHSDVHARKDPSRVVPRPDADRRAEAAQWRSLLTDPRHESLLAEAREIYATFASAAGTHA